MKSDKQRAKHVYPVLDMLKSKIKGLNFEKKKRKKEKEKRKLETYRQTTLL